LLVEELKKLKYTEAPQITGNVEELQKLEAWLKSDVGRETIRQSQIDADKAIEALGLRDIDYDKLREPFTI
jgi:hypothetical protein